MFKTLYCCKTRTALAAASSCPLAVSMSSKLKHKSNYMYMCSTKYERVSTHGENKKYNIYNMFIAAWNNLGSVPFLLRFPNFVPPICLSRKTLGNLQFIEAVTSLGNFQNKSGWTPRYLENAVCQSTESPLLSLSFCLPFWCFATIIVCALILFLNRWA